VADAAVMALPPDAAGAEDEAPAAVDAADAEPLPNNRFAHSRSPLLPKRASLRYLGLSLSQQRNSRTIALRLPGERE
jgi:hypothetical protein